MATLTASVERKSQSTKIVAFKHAKNEAILAAGSWVEIDLWQRRLTIKDVEGTESCCFLCVLLSSPWFSKL